MAKLVLCDCLFSHVLTMNIQSLVHTFDTAAGGLACWTYHLSSYRGWTTQIQNYNVTYECPFTEVSHSMCK